MISPWWVYGIGFVAQLLFSARLVVQWLLSEKHRKVLTPTLFWWLSLIASVILFVYGYLREDFAIMLGQTLTYYIYIRNLHLQGAWQKTPKPMRGLLLLFPSLIVIFAFNNGVYDVEMFFDNENIPLWLLLLGSAAQLIFTFRFIYQWISSEKLQESVLPLGFWILSFSGAILILSYAVFRRDLVLLFGHSFGAFIYARNIHLYYLAKNSQA